MSTFLRGRHPGFWEKARTEARATWRGRFSLLWLAAALGVEGWLLASTNWGAGELLTAWPFRGLCLLAAWGPAWLSADLLCTRLKNNPQREWPPGEVLARAVGRLGPYLLWVLLWSATLTCSVLVSDLRGHQTNGLAQSWREFPVVWVAWTLVIAASAVSFAAGAALLSATSRRPRKWLVLAILAFTSLVLDAANTPRMSPLPTVFTLENLGNVAATPNLWTGYTAGATLTAYFAPGISGGLPFALTCGFAALSFLTFTLLVGVLLGWIAARRQRRHPNTTA